MDRFQNAWMLMNNPQMLAPQSTAAEPYIEVPPMMTPMPRPEEVMMSPNRPKQGVSPAKQFDEMVSQSTGQPQNMSTSGSVKTKIREFEPELVTGLQATREELDALRGQDQAMQMQAIKDYEDQIKQYESGPRQIDWRPLAALLDSWTPGKSNLIQAAQALAPEDIDTQKKNVMAMKKGLSEMKGGVNKNQVALLKEQLDSYLGTLREAQKEKSEERKIAALLAKRDEGLTPGQKAADVAFGKEYAEYSAGGGSENVQKNINLLESAIDDLAQEGEISGGVSGYIGETGQDLLNPKGAEVRDKIRSAIQGTLKQVLGGQFTEKEAQAMFSRAYNPRLSDAENIRRATTELNALKNMANKKMEASKFFEQRGGLSGYRQGSAVDRSQAPSKMSFEEWKASRGR